MDTQEILRSKFRKKLQCGLATNIQLLMLGSAGLEPNENYSYKDDQTLVQFIYWEKGQDLLGREHFGSEYSTYCTYNFKRGGKFSVKGNCSGRRR